MSEQAFTIGGSDAAACLSLDPFRSRIALVAEKLGYPGFERPDATVLRLGRKVEAAVADEVGELYHVVEPGSILMSAVLVDVDAEWRIGHPDRYVEIEGEYGPLEVKTVWSPWQAHGWQDGQAPAHNVLQLLHYMSLDGSDVGMLAGMVAGRLEVRTVERDDALIAAMLEAEYDTVGYLWRGELPPPDGSGSADDAIRLLHPDADPGTRVRFDAELTEAVHDLRLWKESAAKHKARVDELEQKIKMAMGDAEIAVSMSDRVLAKWANGERNAVDVTRLKAGAPHIAKQYTSTTTTRRFTLA